MSNSKITKKVLAQVLKELLREHPLERISIKEIIERCELSRNTFYYHFQDKYELVNWIFYDDIIKNAKTFDDPSKLVDNFIDICKCLLKNREFYLACFQYVGQNCLFETLYNLYYELWKRNLDIRYARSNIKLSQEERDLMARLNSYAFVGIITDWVKKGMNDEYMDYLANVRLLMDMKYLTISEKEVQDALPLTG